MRPRCSGVHGGCGPFRDAASQTIDDCRHVQRGRVECGHAGDDGFAQQQWQLGTAEYGPVDAFLIALDVRTGTLLWEKQIADTMAGYSITSPPLPIRDMIITGIAGGEFGIQGFLEAYDQATGKKLWRFNTVPQPGEPMSTTERRSGQFARTSSIIAA